MIEIIKEDKEKISFKTDISINLANAIRRSVLEIPVLAIDEVEFTKNDSALYDEIIAHRLGLTPLKREDKGGVDKCTCKGQGCSKCTINLKLSASGPCEVSSDELRPKSKVVYKMPITLLKEGQELELNAKARWGRAIEHSKYSPGLVFYRDLAEIKIKDDDEDVGNSCPVEAIEFKEGKLKTKDVSKCDLCMVCV